MPKIYFKTIAFVVAAVILVGLRLNSFFQFFIFATPPEVDGLLEVLIVVSVIAIIINEKFTRGEHWRLRHYVLLFVVPLLFIFIRQALLTL